MRTIPDQASLLINNILLQDVQLRAAGVSHEKRAEAIWPSVCKQLETFQDELLDAQRDAGTALATALNLLGGK